VIDLRRLEEVALNAWPALQQILVDGWVLRFANGYTKRANSINPLYAANEDVSAKIARCEQLYAERNRPPIFRLTSCLAPPELDAALAARGYRHVDPSLVLTLDLRRHTFPTGALELRDEGIDGWMQQFEQINGHPAGQRDTHLAMLQAIPATRLLALGTAGSAVVGCGLGVLDHEYFGLFDLVIAPGRRNQGYGTQLVAAMLSWAQQRGTAYAYLQVMSANAPARRLYGKLGFEEAYQYWYRAPA
jgi:ribosomal protein S18 acetylase RimI-like enzyme